MDQRLNMVMVGAVSVSNLRAFYEQGMGWRNWGSASDMSVMYKVGSAILVFLNSAYLAAESGIPVIAAPKSLWAIFVNDRAEVDTIYASALAARATPTSPVRDRDGGLYSGYFADPEGNGWEVVWSPHMPVNESGEITLAG